MQFKDRVKRYNDRVKGGEKAFAKSVNKEVPQVKKYLKKLDKKGVTKNIKDKGDESDNPDAYKWGTLRKIVSLHFKKNKD